MLIIADAKIPYSEKAFKAFGDVQVVPTREMTHSRIKDADVIFVRSETKINEALLAGTRVRFVGTATIGTDHVDLDYLERNSIGFASCPGSNANSVAEYILAALLEVSSGLRTPLKGKTIGVVGHGNTGSRVARKAEAIGMTVLLNDPPLARSTGDSRYVPLDALMQADFISLHVPLTKTGDDRTYHLFDEMRMRAMKQGSVLLNASRGAVVDNPSLKKLLNEDFFSACVLDVWEGEPAIDTDLLRLVTLGSPHIAGYSHDGKLNATIMLRDALSLFFSMTVVDETLEAAEQTEIRLPISRDVECVLHEAVEQCYSISADDERLRQLLAQPSERRVDYFRELRSKYPRRREFHNFIIRGDDLPADTARVLADIGYAVKRNN